MFSMYSPEPLEDVIRMSPSVFQYPCQKARCAAASVAAGRVASPLMTLAAVASALPPVQVGAATMIRKEPSRLGWNATWAVRASTGTRHVYPPEVRYMYPRTHELGVSRE
jgi:hypothetical protein